MVLVYIWEIAYLIMTAVRAMSVSPVKVRVLPEAIDRRQENNSRNEKATSDFLIFVAIARNRLF